MPTSAGFEPTRAKPNRFRIYRLNQLGHDVTKFDGCKFWYLNFTASFFRPRARLASKTTRSPSSEETFATRPCCLMWASYVSAGYGRILWTGLSLTLDLTAPLAAASDTSSIKAIQIQTFRSLPHTESSRNHLSHCFTSLHMHLVTHIEH